MILVYKFVRVEPNRMEAMAHAEALQDPTLSIQDRKEILGQIKAEESKPTFIPKLVGEYADEAMAKPLIGPGEFAFYESQGDPDPETGLYKSFKLQETKAGPVAKIEAAPVETPKIRRKKKVGI